MGGNATFLGTSYQAKAIVLVYAHILAQSRLGWLEAVNDTPRSVSGESGGAGDDLRIELQGSAGVVEVQAKHGLTAGGKLVDLIRKAHRRSSTGNTDRIVILVNRASSKRVYRAFGGDLPRIRSGRTDQLTATTRQVLDQLPEAKAVLTRLWVVTADLDDTSDPEYKMTLQLLESVLEDAGQAVAALGVLVADASKVCARRLRRTRKELNDLLGSAGVKVKPPLPEEKWLRRLAFTKRLVDGRHCAAALKELADLEQQLGDKQVPPLVRYKLYQQRAAAFLYLERYEEAVESGLRALDSDATIVVAHQTVALAAMLSGHLDLALEHAETAVDEAPDKPVGWVALAQVRAVRSEDLPSPPPVVAESAEYMLTLAQIAANRAEWEDVLSLTGDVLASGSRSPQALYLRSMALLDAARREGSADLASEAERCCSELIELVSDDAHPLTPRALVQRGVARRLLGKGSRAEDDFARAEGLSSADPELLAQRAQRLLDRDDSSGALQVLQHSSVNAHPALLALRARTEAEEQPEVARLDLERCLRLLPEAGDPQGVRIAVAEVAIQLDDMVLAERLLEESSAVVGTTAAWRSLLLARIAFKKGEKELGISLIRKAIAFDPGRRTALLSELAAHLRDADDAAGAAEALGDVPIQELADPAQRLLVAAQIKMHQFAKAQATLDEIAKTGPLPAWALRASVDIALRQEDYETAIQHLMEIVEQGDELAVDVRFELARQLVVLDKIPEAEEQIRALEEAEGLTARQRMFLAHLMNAVAPSHAALDLAFQAYRDAPADPEIHRMFISLAISSRLSPETPTSAAADTFVRLTNASEEEKGYWIVEEGPCDPLRGEISVSEAESLGLLGLESGDELRLHKGTWREEIWTVQEIESATTHAVQDAMLHYEDRFPGEPFFLARFSIGDGTSVKDLAPLIASASERSTFTQTALQAYSERVLPLGAVATTLDVSIADLVAAIGQDPEAPTPVLVEWSDGAGQASSLQVARATTKVVLATSALATISDLGLLERFLARYRFVVPTSLGVEVREWQREARRDLEEGRKSFGAGEGGHLKLDELARGHPALRERLQRRDEIVEALSQMEVMPRPIDSIGPPDAEGEQLRSIIGPASMDAVALATSLRLPLMADDLGLRILAKSKGVEGTFCTVTGLQALAEGGGILSEERDDGLLALVGRGYAFVRPTPSLIARALKTRPNLRQQGLQRVFALLGGPTLEVAEVARTVAQIIRANATASIAMESTRTVVRLCLAGMARRWPPRLCAETVIQACSDALALMPETHLEVSKGVKEFLEHSR